MAMNSDNDDDEDKGIVEESDCSGYENKSESKSVQLLKS